MKEFIIISKELLGAIPNPYFSIPLCIIIIAFIRLLLRVCKRDIDNDEEIHTALAENPGGIDERLTNGKIGHELTIMETNLLPPVGISANILCPHCQNVRHVLLKGFGVYKIACTFLQCGQTYWARISIGTTKANPSIPPPRPISNNRWRS